MGLFSFYCGWMYNDLMSLPIEIGESCWNKPNGAAHGAPMTHVPGCVYPWGLDYRWYQASNELTYFNSFKMKISVIFGVT